MKDKNKVRLKCIDCGKDIYVDKTKITWGGTQRKCKECSIKIFY